MKISPSTWLAVVRIAVSACAAALASLGGDNSNISIVLYLLLAAEAISILAHIFAKSSKTPPMLRPHLYFSSTGRIIAFWTLAAMNLSWPMVPLVVALVEVTIAYCHVSSAAIGVLSRYTLFDRVRAAAHISGVIAMVIISLSWQQNIKIAGDITSVAVIAVSFLTLLKTLVDTFRQFKHE